MPTPEAIAFGALDFLLLSCIGVGAVGLLVIHFFVAPAFAKMFHEFGSALPRVTALVLSPWPMPLMGGIVVATLVVAVFVRLRGRPHTAAVLLALAAAGSVGAIVFCLYALYAPIFDLAGKVAP